MFGLIWRILPGPGFVKFFLSLGIITGVAAFLWFYAFPWVDPYLPFNDVTVEATEGTEAPAEGGESEDGEGDPGVTPESGEGSDEGIVGVDVPIE